MDSQEVAATLATGTPQDTRVVLIAALTGQIPADPDVLAALGSLYVGDQLDAARKDLGAVAGVVAQVAGGVPVLLGGPMAGIARYLEQLAPATRNGAGEVIGRTVHVAAAIRADQGATQAPPGVEQVRVEIAEAIGRVEHAARQLTAYFGGEPGAWKLGDVPVPDGPEADAILSLHDFLNDLTNARR